MLGLLLSGSHFLLDYFGIDQHARAVSSGIGSHDNRL